MSRKKTGRGRGSSAHYALSQIPHVSIYCRGTVSAPHDKWRIATLTPDVINGAIYWGEHRGWYAETGKNEYQRVAPPITQMLDGNRHVARDAQSARVTDPADSDVFYRDTFRTVWDLRCGRCRFSRRVHPANAQDLLTALAPEPPEYVLEIGVREFATRATGHTSA